MKKKDLALDLLDMALARKDEPVALATALIALDRLARQRPDQALTHYASGRILMVMGKYQLAMGAFRVALRSEADLFEAHYFEGVCHWLLGFDDLALEKFATCRKLAPTEMEPYYDAAQIHANRGEHKRALELFDWASDLAPDDFGCKKKLLQTQIRLGLWEAARKTRLELFEMRVSDPAWADVESFVLDQFEVNGHDVVCVETFIPRGDPQVCMSFVVTDGGRLVFTVNLESSVALRSAGLAWVLVAQEGDVRINTEVTYNFRPGYPILRQDAEAVIRRWTADL